MDSLTLAISQGSLRRGSAAIYLPIDHPEIEEFIEIRRPTGGDPNRKALNLHHGVLIPDAFMHAVAEDAAMRERSVGLGVMGFHSFLQSKMIPMEGVMAKVWNRKMFQHIKRQADDASVKLAHERGACPDAADYITSWNVSRTKLRLHPQPPFRLSVVEPPRALNRWPPMPIPTKPSPDPLRSRVRIWKNCFRPKASNRCITAARNQSNDQKVRPAGTGRKWPMTPNPNNWNWAKNLKNTRSASPVNKFQVYIPDI